MARATESSPGGLEWVCLRPGWRRTGIGSRTARLITPVLVWLWILSLIPLSGLRAQPPTDPRHGPPARETFETDANGDGVPDGWYNLRDAQVVDGGRIGAGRMLRFHAERPSRPARISRAFGVDGRRVEALVVGLWVRPQEVDSGERLGEEAGLLIDFLDEGLRSTARGFLGPWTRRIGPDWVRVARRIAVPPATRDAILTVGLMGATGTLEIDGLTIETVPVGGAEATDLLLNGDLELGDPEPAFWVLEGGARRVHPGHRSTSALELREFGGQGADRTGRAARSVLATGRDAGGQRLGPARGGRGAGRPLLPRRGRPAPAGPGADGPASCAGPARSAGGPTAPVVVTVPPGAAHAVLQVEKVDSARVAADRRREARRLAGRRARPLDAVPRPGGNRRLAALSGGRRHRPGLGPGRLGAAGGAGRPARIRHRPGGRLAFEKGERARFFGVALLPPMAFLEPPRAEALADRLARSGINLVRLGDLDAPLGPGLSLFDDGRDDTRALDPTALARLDHLIAALKAAGDLRGAWSSRARVGSGPATGWPRPGAFQPGGARPRRSTRRSARWPRVGRRPAGARQPRDGAGPPRRSGPGVGHARRRAFAVRPDR